MVNQTGPTLDDLMETFGFKPTDFPLNPFQPHVAYFPTMDWLMITLEGGGTTMPLITNVVDLLLNSEGNRIIGIKVWDASKYPRGREILQKHGLIP